MTNHAPQITISTPDAPLPILPNHPAAEAAEYSAPSPGDWTWESVIAEIERLRREVAWLRERDRRRR